MKSSDDVSIIWVKRTQITLYFKGHSVTHFGILGLGCIWLFPVPWKCNLFSSKKNRMKKCSGGWILPLLPAFYNSTSLLQARNLNVKEEIYFSFPLFFYFTKDSNSRTHAHYTMSLTSWATARDGEWVFQMCTLWNEMYLISRYRKYMFLYPSIQIQP